jgi:hypothetical protein
MTKDEALDFALEELENCADLLKVFEAPLDSCVGAAMLGAEKAITAIKQALALDKMADNGRDLGLDYEPVGWWDSKIGFFEEKHFDQLQPLYTTPPAAQPAPVQETMAWRFTGVAGFKRFVTDAQHKAFSPEVQSWYEPFKCSSCTTSPAQPAPVQPMAHIVGEIDHTGKVWKPVQPAPTVQEPVPAAIKTVVEAMQADPDYAWGWHCNIAMAFVDAGGDHYTGNQGAARFMKMLADVEPAHELPSPPPPAAPVQEPVMEYPDYTQGVGWRNVTPPAAQPAVPDALTSADIQEHIEYVAGWNDCRQTMLEMMK